MYDVYFGTSSNPPLRKSNLSSSTCKAKDLFFVSYDIKYYWQVVAKDDHQHETVGPVWNFTTRASEDVPYYYYIESIWWSNEIDNDGDDYTSYRRLHFDVNVSCGTHNVYAEIWECYTGSGTTWRYLTTSNYTVSGASTNDAYSVDVGLPNDEISHGIYDFEIMICESGDDSVVASDGRMFNKFETTAEDAGSVGGQIVFNSDRDNNAGELYVMNADGTDQHRLTNNGFTEYNPSWSPDGTMIAFHAYRESYRHEIYIMNSYGTNIRNLTNDASYDMNPSWSPDGSHISFCSNRSGYHQILTVKTDGTDVRTITNGKEPCWSPGGSRIAFVRGGDIYVINVDGSGERRVTASSGIDQEPAWSPDGGEIAFCSYRNENNDIYTINADGSSERNITNSGTVEYDPCWSPDGTVLCFSSLRSGSWDIYVMNRDGSNQHNISNTISFEHQPSWSWVP